jgi:hypothetical protein
MKILLATTMASCLAFQTLAGTVAWKDNSPRAMDSQNIDKRVTVNTLPLVNPLCDGYSVQVSDISRAVNQGGNLMGNNVQRGEFRTEAYFASYFTDFNPHQAKTTTRTSSETLATAAPISSPGPTVRPGQEHGTSSLC